MNGHKYIVTYRDIEANKILDHYVLDYRPTMAGLRARMTGCQPIGCTVEHTLDGTQPSGLQRFEGTNYTRFHDVTMHRLTGNTFAL